MDLGTTAPLRSRLGTRSCEFSVSYTQGQFVVSDLHWVVWRWNMTDTPATVTYAVAEPFEQAVKSLRRALTGGNLKITSELDMSGRIRQRLLIGTAPCRILFVSASASALENESAGPYAAALTPMHIVVSARGPLTEIHMLHASPADNGVLDRPAAAAFQRLQTETAQAIETIGMRTTLGA